MLFLVGSQQVLWRRYRGLNNSPLVITPINLYTSYGLNKFYGAVAGDRKNLVINIQTKEGNTNLDFFLKKKRKRQKKNSFSNSGYF